MADSQRLPTLWQNVPASLSIRNAEILVFAVDPVLAPAKARHLLEQLSSEENATARRFRRDESRCQFVSCRHALRAILANLTGLEPRRIEFARSDLGKPFMVTPPGVAPLHFNVAHTEGLGLIAVASDLRVGIDVERLGSIAVDRVGEVSFTERERLLLSQCPDEARLALFYRLWTRKEALLKAAGVGFSVDPALVDVAANHDQSQTLVSLANSTREPRLWRITDLVPTAMHLGAIAHEEAATVPIRYYRLADTGS